MVLFESYFSRTDIIVNNKNKCMLIMLLISQLVVGCGGGSASGGNGSDGPRSESVSENTLDSPQSPMVDVDPVHSLRSMQMVLELDNQDDFFAQGFPTNFKLDEQNKVDVSAFPIGNFAQLVPNYQYVMNRDIMGYAPNIPLFIQFGSGVLNAMLALEDNPVAYANSSAVVQLVDVDPNSPERGRRFPVYVTFEEKGSLYRPGGHLLQALPAGEMLRENTSYALVVLSSVMPTVSPLTSKNSILSSLLQSNDPRELDSNITLAASHKALLTYAPLREQWLLEGLDVDQIIGAIVWTTGEPSQKMRQVISYVATLPPNEPSQSLELEVEEEGYCVLKSAFHVPVYQTGSAPYLILGDTEVGLMRLNTEGEPVLHHQREAEFRVVIPKQDMPDSGFPLVLFHHGSMGSSEQLFERGVTDENGISRHRSASHIASMRGWALAGMDHDKLSSPFNFLNITAMRDTFIQMVSEQAAFRRVINNLTIDGDLCPGASAGLDGFFFDTENQVVMGQSQGSMVALAQGATDPMGYQGIIAGGPGSFNVGTVMNISPRETALYLNGVRITSGTFIGPIFMEDLTASLVTDNFHPLYALTQMVVAQADFSIHLSRWTREPDVGVSAPDMLVVEGYYDEWLRPWNRDQLLIAAGVDLIGPDLTDIGVDHQILPQIAPAGQTQRWENVTNNRNNRTVGVVYYPEDEFMTGHHAMFQREAAQHQYGCFLKTLYLYGEATIIVDGLAYNSPCP
ncbi:hypothetical protein A9Q99_27205 [Gammaproteobacteria bacterium 45_16_T64]|nr:hypothetical protein A9Q99_27205 [Gammaproteobacteria bacterium 45_16_T64]